MTKGDGAMTVFAIVGMIASAIIAILIIMILVWLVKEAIRSWRQICRKTRWTVGRDWKREARKRWRTFLKIWAKEFGSGYHSVEIRGLSFPYNPRERMTRRYYG